MIMCDDNKDIFLWGYHDDTTTIIFMCLLLCATNVYFGW